MSNCKPLRIPLLLLTLVLLSGCSGGGGNAPLSASKSGPAANADAYTIVDLGAADYYYGYYGAISDFGRYGPRISINDQGKIINPNSGTAAVFDGTLHPLSTVLSAANGINNLGQAVGFLYNFNASNGSFQFEHATLWQTDGTPTDMGAFGNGNSVAYAINDNGLVAGDADITTSNPYTYASHAFLYTSSLIDLGTLGGSYSHAAALSSNMVVGWSTTTTNPTNVPGYNGSYGLPVHAFSWSSGKMTDLGTLSGGQSSDAAAINEAGLIAGSSSTTPQGLYNFAALHAVTWQGGVIHDLGTLGGPGSIAYGINSQGAVVGSADTSTLAPIPPPYSYYYGYAGTGTGGLGGGGAGGSTGSGTPTNPISAGAGGGLPHRAGLSATGQRATRGLGDTYIPHAFLYTGGQMVDLNTQIAGTPGWELLQATGINAKGQIVGFGTLGNHLHAFELTPKQP